LIIFIHWSDKTSSK